ncbi:MAG: tRNA preQ1(34) S-adenosylmethionine ribosyltransferase-isomerase QueA [candidate division WOR-3 bacterium]|nr:tRNA preQ1(34) S-adenosylmethionine ribosyltransferase-isomerase QueA [candidate division WOR-3 bacterium]
MQTPFSDTETDMDISKFDYNLPEELIAAYPKPRGQSRLMLLDRKNRTIEHRMFSELPDILDYPLTIVRNITRVIKTRLFARRETGASIELLILNPYVEGNEFEALINKGGRLKMGEMLNLDADSRIEIISRDKEVFKIRIIPQKNIHDIFSELGHVPLPPYIKRPDEANDANAYQTVYSKINGSSAAPTAGLHFSDEIIFDLKNRGAEILDILLHVGLGTFEPVKTDKIEEHDMHSEYFSISSDICSKLNNTDRKKNPILAIGTTSIRVLETVYDGDTERFHADTGHTDIFIHPPMKVHSADMLLTNFHLPRSTLLMLVSSFAGRKFILNAYAEAIEENYRFFSYGDSMLIR